MTKLKAGDYMTVTEYAKSKSVSVQYVRKLLGEWKIPGAVRVGSIWLIKIS